MSEGHLFSGIALDPKGEKLLVGGSSGHVLLTSLDDGAARPLSGFSSSANVTPVAFDPQGRLAAAAPRLGPANEKVIRVWDLESGKVRVLGPVEGASDGFEGGYEFLRFTRDSRLLSSARGSLRSWNLSDGSHEVLAKGEWIGYGMALSNDGRTLLHVRGTGAVEGESGELVRLDLQKGTSETLASHGKRLIGHVALDPTETLVATRDLDGIVRVGPITGEDPHLLLGHQGAVRAVAVSPDGRFIASAGTDRTIRLWPMPHGSPFHTLPLEEILARLRLVTNVRVVEDRTSPTGYQVSLDPSPGWATVPSWSDPPDPTEAK